MFSPKKKGNVVVVVAVVDDGQFLIDLYHVVNM